MLRNKRVVVLAYDRLCTFEFGIALEIFGLPRPELDVDWYELDVVAISPGPVELLGGATLSASDDLELIETAGMVVIPGWPDADACVPPNLIAALQTAQRNSARLVSICAGAFVLAAAGLLDGLSATTHWRFCDQLASRYPAIDVVPNVLFTDNGQILTSAGSAAGIDLGLHVIRHDFGASVAANVARRLVTQPLRDGNQAQFIPALTPANTDDGGRISLTMQWALHHIDEDITVARLASEAHMSPRNFARRFVVETGTTPQAWVLDQRLGVARELLERTDLSTGAVAVESGFRTAETLRHHFRKRLGTSPQRYRRSFSLTVAADR